MSLERRERLRERLLLLGFDVVRFAPASGPVPDGLRAWLAAGNHADMDWMERTLEKRLAPELILPGARTVVVFGVNYWPGTSGSVGHFARYALNSDYHDTIREALVAAGQVVESECGLGPDDHRYYVDAGPVQERGWAALAGLGFRGKNGNIISREMGNWLLLAALLMRAEVAPDQPLATEGEAGRAGLHCGRCTRCLDICPTGAFTASGLLDSRRCISYHTIENRGWVPRDLRAAFGTRVFGCDDCLAVCPWNRFARESHSILLERRHDLAALSLLDLLRLTQEGFSQVFRATAVKRTKLAGILRNSCISAGNAWAGQGTGSPAIADLCRLAQYSASPVVRGHAVWALHRIVGDPATAGDCLAVAKTQESDPQVLAEYHAAGACSVSSSGG